MNSKEKIIYKTLGIILGKLHKLEIRIQYLTELIEMMDDYPDSSYFERDDD